MSALNSTNRPPLLGGKRVLVTRSHEQAASFSERLRALGAVPFEFPAIRIAPPLDRQPLDDALTLLFAAAPAYHYDWLIFTSTNGVEQVFERKRELGLTMPLPGSTRTAVIGPATAAALAQHGIQTDVMPGEYIAEAVAAALIEDARRRGDSLEGKRILLPRAAEARDVLITELHAAGAIVHEVAAYRTLPVGSDDAGGREVARMLRSGELDVLTFTSSSTVRNFIQWLAQCAPDITAKLREDDAGEALPAIACIGPITARTVRELGLHATIEATTFTIDGLIEAIVQDEGKK